MNNNIKNHIMELELKLLQTDMSQNPEIIDALLSDDFEEIGNKGHISSRDEVISWLLKKDNNIQWVLDDFRVRELAPNLVLAIYRENISNNPNKSSRGSMRSSVWKKQGKQWKIIFHQGTKIASG